MKRRPYHHGDLREGLIQAARAAVETGGPDAVSLRDIAQSLGVSTAAPYRHFPDRKALLAEVAARGFDDLRAAYDQAQAGAATPALAMRGAARAYLNLALQRPGLFRLMFAGDLIGADSPPALLAAAGAAWESLYRAVQASDPKADLATMKRRAIGGWSTLHGFITLTQGGRLPPFMTQPLSEDDLLEAILDKALGGP